MRLFFFLLRLPTTSNRLRLNFLLWNLVKAVLEKQKDKKDAEDLKEQIEQLTLAVEDLKKKQGEPGASSGIDIALKELEKGNTAKAENIFRQVVKDKIKEGANAKKEAAKASRHLGSLAFFHDIKRSLEAYQQAVKFDPDNPDGWNQLGHLQHRKGNLEAALQSYSQVLRIAETENKKKWLGTAYGNLGNIYGLYRELDKAEEYYKKSLAINMELGRKEAVGKSYGNLGLVYHNRGNFNKAEEYHKKALVIEIELGRKESIASTYGSLGLIYQDRGELDKAREEFEKSINLFRVAGANRMVKITQKAIDSLELSQSTEQESKR